MAKVHHFQRYSSFENTVTNNTLQLIGHIYAYAPQKAADFINQLVDADEPIEIGLEIQQQRRGPKSVPDGTIIQRSFKIIIETKVHAAVSVPQLLSHAKDFSGEEHKILMLLTKQPLEKSEEKRIRDELAVAARGVIFAGVTFEDVISTLGGLFQPYEYEMNALVEDFVEYCWDASLVDRSRYLLRVVPCGQSLEINMRHGIYFHPSDRGYSDHRFTGVYKDKRVQTIWENDAVFDVTLVAGKLEKTLVAGRATDEYDERLRAIIADARSECGYEVAKGHRFFCGTAHPTSFVKASRGGIMGRRYFDVTEVVGDFTDVADLAAKLTERTWD